MKKAVKRKRPSPRTVRAKRSAGKRTPAPRRTRRAQAALKKQQPFRFEKFEKNPVIEPRSHNSWESKATFNPAAMRARGRVHILYRAIGDGDMSVLGYASSLDGLHFDERHDAPAYAPPGIIKDVAERTASNSIVYASGGGGWGGAEDPRLVAIDDRVYMTFLAFNGWDSARIALTSINLADFLGGRWNWTPPTLISPTGEVHKNWVLFPEKIQGKFAILHGVSPEIHVDYFDSFDVFRHRGPIKSAPPSGGRKDNWDNWMRGAGPPPIKTKYGWLLLYHAMDRRDPDRYKLGAMILNAKDPTKVLYRTRSPILEPDEAYENEGHKAGVIYSCGAVVVGKKLFIYYGGADTVTCVASADLASFLEELKKGRTPKLQSEKSKTTKNV